MSNERHETVADNMSVNHQFREVAKMIPHEEVAVSKMETTTPTGNSAAMRKALEKVRRVLHCAIVADILKGDDVNGAFNEVIVSLSAPPRNCDLLSDAQEALAAIHEDRCYVNNPIDERRLTVEWLFAETKGETDGSK